MGPTAISEHHAAYERPCSTGQIMGLYRVRSMFVSNVLRYFTKVIILYDAGSNDDHLADKYFLEKRVRR